MRKLSVYALSAATVFSITALAPMTSQAAVTTYNLQGGKGAVVVIGGNNGDCQTQFPGFPDFNKPWFNTPGANIPDISLPSPEFPTPDGGMQDTLPENPGNGNSSSDAYVSQVLNLVNQERAKAGAAPLTLDSKATQAAQLRAQEIERSFSHTRPDGSSFSTALTAFGVNFRSSGENIAYGQNSPESVMNGWMNSAGHRANILNSSFTSIGIGHYKGANGVDYWTQLFIN